MSMMERHNRRSHLAPQLSPATKSLLRGEDRSSKGSSSRNPTPLSGEIPISAAINGSNSSRSHAEYSESPSMSNATPVSLPIRVAPQPQVNIPKPSKRTESAINADQYVHDHRGQMHRFRSEPQKPQFGGPEPQQHDGSYF